MTVEHLKFGAYGLAAGLLIAFIVWLFGLWSRRELRREIRKLREHLHTHMEISHEGSDKRLRELEQLKAENANLRVTIKAWQQKPGRHELRSLQVYDIAVHRLLETTPGFSMAWEVALKDAEEKMERSDRGLLAFTRRLILSRGDPKPSPVPAAKPGSDPGEASD